MLSTLLLHVPTWSLGKCLLMLAHVQLSNNICEGVLHCAAMRGHRGAARCAGAHGGRADDEGAEAGRLLEGPAGAC